MRLNKFISTRSHVKKSIMTIAYNSSVKAIKNYLTDILVKLDCNEGDKSWYSTSESNSKYKISDKDLYLLITTLKSIINNDF